MGNWRWLVRIGRLDVLAMARQVPSLCLKSSANDAGKAKVAGCFDGGLKTHLLYFRGIWQKKGRQKPTTARKRLLLSLVPLFPCSLPFPSRSE
jgi:hypothetical protein